MFFKLFIQAQQVDNADRSVTTILSVNVYELNIYPPSFLGSPYLMIGYKTENLNEIPTFNASVNDNDTVNELLE